MDWISRNIDQPLLNGAAGSLRAWHSLTRKPPQWLEPTWHLAVLSLLVIAAGHFLHGRPLLLSIAALILLALPSVWKLLSAAMKGGHNYGAREYKSLSARAIAKREGEWSLRLTVLVMSAGLPFFALPGDPTGAIFMLGGSFWFVLTAPVKFYLDAAEPPEPDEGDTAFQAALRFG